MSRLRLMRDPYDPQGEPMVVDMDDMIRIKIRDNWCSGCKDYVPWVDGRWTYWLGEPDLWYCEKCK